MNQSSILLGGLQRLQNKQNLSGDQIKQMIELLKAYESLCIQRQDFSGADNIKTKIQQLKIQELVFRKQNIATKQKEQVQQICKQGQIQIKQFQQSWDKAIQQLIDQLKTQEEQLLESQAEQMRKYKQIIQKQQPPRPKPSSALLEKRKYLSSLIKARNYKEAQNIKNIVREMQLEQQQKWAQKWNKKKQIKIQQLERKQMGQLQALRVKLQALFNQKVKERDRKFQILLKKNRKRRIQSSKPSKQRLRSKNGRLSQSKTQLGTLADSKIHKINSSKIYS